VVALTGAGISAESGIPTFRGPGGLWRQRRPEQLATPAAFAHDPKLVWEWYDWRRCVIVKAEPNPGHKALASLEASKPGFTLVTQNVDGLHDRAGSRRILKLHGDIWMVRCTACRREKRDDRAPLPELPPLVPAVPPLPSLPELPPVAPPPRPEAPAAASPVPPDPEMPSSLLPPQATPNQIGLLSATSTTV